MSYPPASIPTNIFVIYATLLDYVIAHLAIAKNLLSKSFTSMPSTSGELTTHQHEIASWLHRRFRWLLCSIGPWLLNATLACSDLLVLGEFSYRIDWAEYTNRYTSADTITRECA